MARKRMFDLEIINQESFFELPMDAKALYFLLGMEADDEGFVSPKKVLRLYGGSEDSIKILALKNYIIPFKSGVVVITDWKRNNYLDKNRIKETIYNEEKEQLEYDEKKEKYLLKEQCLTSVKQMLNQYSIEEKRLEEISIEEKRVEEGAKTSFEELIQTYNKYCTNLPQALKTTDKRKKAIKEFLKQFNLEEFEQICIKANTSDFLTGENDRTWKADIDFILRTDKATSILEGKYDNLSNKKQSFTEMMKEIYEEVKENDNGGNNESTSSIW